MLLAALTGRKDITLITAGGELDAQKGLNIRHMGFINNPDQMGELYSLSDLFVLPSMAENFPNTIIEALCCGIPVVAARTGGIPEIINDSNGKLYLPGDVNGLREAIDQVILNPGSYDRLKISEHSRRIYNNRQAVDSYLEIYKKLLSR